MGARVGEAQIVEENPHLRASRHPRGDVPRHFCVLAGARSIRTGGDGHFAEPFGGDGPPHEYRVFNRVATSAGARLIQYAVPGGAGRRRPSPQCWGLVSR